MIKLGSIEPDNFLLGSTQVDALYQGTEKVWPAIPTLLELKWDRINGNVQLYLENPMDYSNDGGNSFVQIGPGNVTLDPGAGSYILKEIEGEPITSISFEGQSAIEGTLICSGGANLVTAYRMFVTLGGLSSIDCSRMNTINIT